MNIIAAIQNTISSSIVDLQEKFFRMSKTAVQKLL